MVQLDIPLTFREFLMREQFPLATIHEAVLEFLRGRDDVVLFGAQAVNAYVDQPRMTQDVDLLAIGAAQVAEELRSHLHDLFQIAVRIREVQASQGFRIFQVRSPKNRHLVDIRAVTELPPHQRMDDIPVVLPSELIRMKVVSMVSRPKTAKGLTDAADLRRLLLAFPELKLEQGVVTDRLTEPGTPPEALAAWHDLVHEEIIADDDEDY